MHRPDPATFEVGPTGLAYDPTLDILFVASTGDNAVFAVKHANEIRPSRGRGELVYFDPVPFAWSFGDGTCSKWPPAGQ